MMSYLLHCVVCHRISVVAASVQGDTVYFAPSPPYGHSTLTRFLAHTVGATADATHAATAHTPLFVRGEDPLPARPDTPPPAARR